MTVRERLNKVPDKPSADAAHPMLVSREQVAKMSGYSIGSIIRFESLGFLRPVKLIGTPKGRTRYWLHEVHAWLSGRERN
jgi:hypothetical protein